MSGSRYVAVDLGAESGRVMVGTLLDGRLVLDEVHRFANIPVRTPDGLHWDVLRLYHEIVTGLRAVTQRFGKDIAGIGIDSWGADYGLLDAGGRLLGNPYHYRDARTDGIPEGAARLVPAATQYARTGIAQLTFNTIYQLMAEVRSRDRRLEQATSLLLIPDLLHYWLSGEVATEYTNATTTGMLGADGAWAIDLLARLDVPTHMLLSPTPAGSILGKLCSGVQAECGLGPAPVISPATHDTAGAVAAVPMHGRGMESLYISSGTWSLAGLELKQPILGEEARLAGFTNEGGFGGTFRFLTNIMGLWLVQECRRAWVRAGSDWSYDDLTAAAAATPSPGVAIDVNDPAFMHPENMPAALAAQLARTGQGQLDSVVMIVRAILESLAVKYRFALESAERLAGTSVGVIHIVGGGSHNRLLCQLTADACKRPVLAGPAEATAMGNVLVQAIGRGEVRDLAEARAVVRNSAQPAIYEPSGDGRLDVLYGRLLSLQSVARG